MDLVSIRKMKEWGFVAALCAATNPHSPEFSDRLLVRGLFKDVQVGIRFESRFFVEGISGRS
jgi:hypothetical protein